MIFDVGLMVLKPQPLELATQKVAFRLDMLEIHPIFYYIPPV